MLIWPLLSASLASAAVRVPDLFYVSKKASAEPGQQTPVSVACPEDTKVVGGGVRSEADFEPPAGFFGTAARGVTPVNTTRPADGPDPGNARDDAWISFVDNRTSPRDELVGRDFATFEIQGYAICAGRRLARSISYVTERSSIPLHESQGLTAECPRGARVLGGGASNSADWGMRSAKLVSTRPADGRDSDEDRDDAWYGFVDNDWDREDFITMTVFAVCAQPDDIDAHLSLERRVTRTEPEEQGSTSVGCPNGSNVLSGGASNNGGYGVSINTSRPEDGGDEGPGRDDGWIGFFDNVATDPRDVTAWALCAKAKRRRSGTGEFDVPPEDTNVPRGPIFL